MMLEPLVGGSNGTPPTVEGSVEWECIDVEHAFQVAAAASLDPEQFRAVARALLARAMAAGLNESRYTSRFGTDALGAA